ncbi:hypothetical protein CRENBAI_017725, partial [Crenichthys baileyi]
MKSDETVRVVRDGCMMAVISNIRDRKRVLTREEDGCEPSLDSQKEMFNEYLEQLQSAVIFLSHNVRDALTKESTGKEPEEITEGEWMYRKVFHRTWNEPRWIGPFKVVTDTTYSLRVWLDEHQKKGRCSHKACSYCVSIFTVLLSSDTHAGPSPPLHDLTDLQSFASAQERRTFSTRGPPAVGCWAEHSSSQVQHVRCNQPGSLKRLEASHSSPECLPSL